MTITEVWGRIQGQDSFPVTRSGNTWSFHVPSWVIGDVYTEFWAKDEAGNISYRSAILTIDKTGTLKCVRMRGRSRAQITMRGHTCPRMEA